MSGDYFREVRFFNHMENIDDGISDVRHALNKSNNYLSSIEESTSAMTSLFAKFVQMHAQDRALQMKIDQEWREFRLRWDTWDLKTRKAFIEELDRQRAVERRETEARKAEARFQKAREAEESSRKLGLRNDSIDRTIEKWNQEFRNKVITSLPFANGTRFVLSIFYYLSLFAAAQPGVSFWLLSPHGGGDSPIGAAIFVFVVELLVTLGFGLFFFLPVFFIAPHLFRNLFNWIMKRHLKAKGMQYANLDVGHYFAVSASHIRNFSKKIRLNATIPLSTFNHEDDRRYAANAVRK